MASFVSMTLGGGAAQSGSATPGSSPSSLPPASLPPASSSIPPIPVLRPAAAGAGGSSSSSYPSTHPYSLIWFRENRPEVANFVDQILTAVQAGKRHILVKAPVKSGKRVMVEVISLLLGMKVKYITSLNRKDVKTQKAELDRYNIHTHLTNSRENVDAAIADIHFDLDRGHRVVTCFDECDYGAGNRQLLPALYENIIDNIDVVKIYFSATAHETAASNLKKRADYIDMTYVPPPEYCGAQYFLDNGLIFEPLDFFENALGELSVTEHGIQVIRDSVTATRHIGVVRTTSKFPPALFKNDLVRANLERQLQAAMPDGKPWKIKPVDDKDGHDWEHRQTQIGYTRDDEVNHLFVILGTCTRGTDLKGWHRNLAFWHDKRMGEKSNLNTLIQAALRPCHYKSDYGGEAQPVRLYVDRRVVEMAADDDMAKYLATGGKEPARTKAVAGGKEKWQVPIRVLIPDSVMSEPAVKDALDNNLTAARRAVLKDRIWSLLTPVECERLDVRTLKGKRVYDSRDTQGGIFTVDRAYKEKLGSRPGGGNTNIDEIRNDHYWLDIALDALPGIPRGTAYITTGGESDAIYTARSSMYEARRGEI